MESRKLEVTVNLAEDLQNLRHLSTMDVYVVVPLSGDERYKTKQETRIHQDCGTNPQWGQAFSFNVDEAVARAGRLTLNFEIKDEHTLCGHMDIGWVDVPVKELLEQGSGAEDGEPKVMCCKVRLPSGETKGVLEFSYKFSERFTVATPPEARNEPVIADPAAAAPSSSSSVVGCPPNADPSYPQQRYGYPKSGYQRPPAGGRLMTGLKVGNQILDGIMTGQMVGDAISNDVKSDDEAGDEA